MLKQSGKSYKNASRLLRLGHLLRASSKEQLEAQIYVRIAEVALSKQDFDVASQMCCKLRSANHGTVGWKVCVKLAKYDEVTDVSFKMDLVSFALVYCSADVMEELLQLRWTLEAIDLRDKTKRQVEMYVDYESGDESLLNILDSLAVESYRHEVGKRRASVAVAANNYKAASESAQQVFQKTAETTKQLVDVVKSKFKGQQGMAVGSGGGAANKLPPIAACKPDNSSCCRWALPVFYWDDTDYGRLELHESQLSTSYRLFSLPEMPCNEFNLLNYSWRLQILDSLREPYTKICLKDDSVLCKLVEFVLSEDCVLALSILLDVIDPAKAWEQTLTRLPSTEVTLQTAAIYFALRILQHDDANVTYECRPRTMIDRCLSRSSASLIKEQRILQDFLKRSLRLLADVSEAQQLRRLDSGVDINRFTLDENYKCDTIVGLAITTDASVYAAAVRLAAHYGVSQWQVCFSHLTAMFSDESIQPSEMMRRMDDDGDGGAMRKILYQDKETFGRQMVQVIYPSISGRDHQRLVLFFNILNADPLMAEMLEPSASTSLQIIERLDSSSSSHTDGLANIDVKKLMRSADGFVAEVERAINADNVGKLAKVAQFCSTSVKTLAPSINQGTVHSIWARKYFFQLTKEKEVLSSVDWLHRFESCKKHTAKLAAKELLQLTDGLCFSEEALDTLTLDVRAELCRRCLKLVVVDKKKKKNGAAAVSKKEDCEEEAAKLRLEKWSSHLERLGSDEYCELFEKIRSEVVSSVGGSQSHWREFEKSRAEEERLHRLLLRILVEKHPMSVVQLLIGVFPSDFSWTPEDVLVDALRLVLDFLRIANGGGGSAVAKEAETGSNNQSGVQEHKEKSVVLPLSENEAMPVLLHLLTQVRNNIIDDGGGMGGLISHSDIEDMLRHFYEDDAIDVHVRLALLQALPDDFVGGAKCTAGSRIRWLRTLALIQQTWLSPKNQHEERVLFLDQLCEEHLESEQERRVLFDRLLKISHADVERLSSLAKILHFWPPFGPPSSQDDYQR